MFIQLATITAALEADNALLYVFVGWPPSRVQWSHARQQLVVLTEWSGSTSGGRAWRGGLWANERSLNTPSVSANELANLRSPSYTRMNNVLYCTNTIGTCEMWLRLINSCAIILALVRTHCWNNTNKGRRLGWMCSPAGDRRSLACRLPKRKEAWVYWNTSGQENPCLNLKFLDNLCKSFWY